MLEQLNFISLPRQHSKAFGEDSKAPGEEPMKTFRDGEAPGEATRVILERSAIDQELQEENALEWRDSQ